MIFFEKSSNRRTMGEMNLDDAKAFLMQNGQLDLVQHLDDSDEVTEKAIATQISHLAALYDSVPTPEHLPPPADASPLDECETLSDAHIDLGKEAFSQGKVAALILAGGEGSRLNYHYPKGCYPTSPVRQKSLFQLVLERAKAAENLYGTQIRLGFVVSHKSYPLVLNFLRDNNGFGFPIDQIDLLPQPFLPYYHEKKWLLATQKSLALGPNGNGGLLDIFANTPYLSHLKERGIDHITLTSIDNPLADPFDAKMVGAHLAKKADATLIALPHNPKRPHVGTLCQTKSGLAIVDYTKKESHGLANANIFTFSREFLEKSAQKNLPIHWVEKETAIYDPLIKKEERIKALKGEKFITDLISLAKNPLPLLAQERDCFAPLKNLKGIDSVATCQEAIYRKNREILDSLTGAPTSRNVELAASFYYPTEELKKAWSGRKVPPQSYITEDL